MKPRQYSIKLAIFSLMLAVSTGHILAQKPSSATPRQEKLLNGLKLLMWSEPKSDKVSIKIRVHSGSSFDPQQKEGVMRLLSESIFPNEGAKEFFTEELNGNLDIVCNYDYIQINASGDSNRILDMLQTLASAVTNPTIDKETTTRLKTALLAKVGALEKDPGYLADQEAVKLLFGRFPYGRPEMGSSASIQKIEFPDLLEAKERFFSADNATLTLTGSYNSDQAYKAIRRYFGSWLKSDGKVPSTFSQPDGPDTDLQGNGNTASGGVEARYVLRGLARNDKDFPASEILTRIARSRWQASQAPSLKAENLTVRNESHILPGYLIFGMTLPALPAENRPGKKTGEQLLPKNITESEFSKAKAEILQEIGGRDLQNRWLDVDTFKGLSVDKESAAYQDATLADVQRVADRLMKNPVVSLLWTTSAEPAAAN